MVTLILPRLVSFEGAGRRSASMVERNVATLRSAYWVVMVTGFLEPVLFLLSIGLGVGELVGDLPGPHGQPIAYDQFVAPGMLAAAAMNGAILDTTYNFFVKFKYAHTYDAMLAKSHGFTRTDGCSGGNPRVGA